MSKKVHVDAPNGEAWLFVVEGVVTHLDTQRWFDTHVSSSGGGGYVGPQGGTVYAPSVHSTVTQRQQSKFWMREADGTEHDFTLTDSDFAVAPGHKVRMAWGAKVGKERGDYLFAHNFNSRQGWEFHSRDWNDWCAKEGLIVYAQSQGCGLGCLSIFIGLLSMMSFIAALGAKTQISYSDYAANQNAQTANICCCCGLIFMAILVLSRLVSARRYAKTSRELASQKSCASDFCQRMRDEFNKTM